MKHLAVIFAALAWPVMALSFIACGNEKKINSATPATVTPASNKDTLSYNFRDASTPPKYHRSYTIRVTPGQVYFSIDVYGDIISKDSSVLTTAAYTFFVKALNELHIKNKKAVENTGCTGGTTDQLTLYPGSNKEVKGYIYNCGGRKFGDLEGDVAAAANLFKALVPGLQQKIDATRKNN